MPEHVHRLRPTWQLIRLLSSNVTAGPKITVITRKLIMTSATGGGEGGNGVRYSTRTLLSKNFTVKRALRERSLRESTATTLLVRIYGIVRLRPMRSSYSAAGNSAVTIMACILSRSMRRVARILLSVTTRTPFTRKHHFRRLSAMRTGLIL